MLELGTGKTSYCIAFNVYHKFLIYFLLLSVNQPIQRFIVGSKHFLSGWEFSLYYATSLCM